MTFSNETSSTYNNQSSKEVKFCLDRNELLNYLTEDKLISFMEEELDSIFYRKENGALVFGAICHGNPDSNKLYFYTSTKTFHCYSQCGCNYSIYDLISEVLQVDFAEAFKYLAKYLGVEVKRQEIKGIGKKKKENNYKFLKKIKRNNLKEQQEIQPYSSNILNCFEYNLIYEEWLEEGIDIKAIDRFRIGYYDYGKQITIPYFYMDGSLAGVRVRNLDKEMSELMGKYHPITVQGVTYKFPSKNSFYGAYENKKDIMKTHRCILFEGEKSVLKICSWYEDSVGLGLLGMNFSIRQANILKELGVEEVIVALDKQYKQEEIGDRKSEGYREYTNYLRKIYKIVKMLEKFMSVSVILDFDGLLEYKDSPVDKGKEVFEELYSKRISYKSEELERAIEERLKGE